MSQVGEYFMPPLEDASRHLRLIDRNSVGPFVFSRSCDVQPLSSRPAEQFGGDLSHVTVICGMSHVYEKPSCVPPVVYKCSPAHPRRVVLFDHIVDEARLIIGKLTESIIIPGEQDLTAIEGLSSEI